MPHARHIAALSAVAAAAALVGGCGEGGGPERPAAIAAPAAPKAGELSFAGKRFGGTLFVAGGPDGLNQELYRVDGTFSSARRVTHRGRISAVSAGGGLAVTANAMGTGNDRVEAINPRAARALPGRVLDQQAQAPAVSRTGRVAFSAPHYGRRGSDLGTNIITTARDGSHRRIAFRSSIDATSAWAGNRLAVLTQRNPERPTRARLVLDAGGPGERTVDPGVGSATLVFGAADGRIAVPGSGEDKRVAIVSPGGATKVLRTAWGVLGWAPDGRLLVSRPGRLGLMSVADAKVEPLARVRGGDVYSAGWLA